MAKSKNDPTMRGKAKDTTYQGKKVVPVMYVGQNTKYVAAQFDNGPIVLDESSKPVSWAAVS